VAHANFLTPADVALMVGAGASVAHCPLSNFYFANSVFPVREFHQRGLGMGLGSDISGGYSPNLFDACRHAMTASLALHEGTDPDRSAARRGRNAQNRPARIDPVFAFWLATTAGARALDWPDLAIGQLAPGYAMDAIAIDTLAEDSNLQIWAGQDTLPDVLQKIIHHATRTNVARTWVQGKQVHCKHPS